MLRNSSHHTEQATADISYQKMLEKTLRSYLFSILVITEISEYLLCFFHAKNPLRTCGNASGAVVYLTCAWKVEQETENQGSGLFTPTPKEADPILQTLAKLTCKGRRKKREIAAISRRKLCIPTPSPSSAYVFYLLFSSAWYITSLGNRDKGEVSHLRSKCHSSWVRDFHCV